VAGGAPVRSEQRWVVVELRLDREVFQLASGCSGETRNDDDRQRTAPALASRWPPRPPLLLNGRSRVATRGGASTHVPGQRSPSSPALERAVAARGGASTNVSGQRSRAHGQIYRRQAVEGGLGEVEHGGRQEAGDEGEERC
jgi:hypothetical protein